MTNLISSFTDEIAKMYREALRGVNEEGVPSTRFTTFITHPEDTGTEDIDRRKFIQISKKQFDSVTNNSGYNGPMIRISYQDGEFSNLGIGSEQSWTATDSTWEIIFDTTQVKDKEEYWQRTWQNEILKTLTYNMTKIKELICFINVRYEIDNLNDVDEFKKRLNVIHDIIVQNG